MPLKIQYPVQLHADTKCPSCGNGINSLGGNVYVCSAGHVIEGILLVTQKVKGQQKPIQVSSETPSEEVITPSYEKAKTQ